jgi:CheY-like chemotaxis protein
MTNGLFRRRAKLPGRWQVARCFFRNWMTPKNILIVEDHEHSALGLARVLTRQGHSVQVAGTLEEARGLVADRSFDIALCDLGLPDGDGCDLMRELAAQYNIKGIALTGFGMPQDLERAKEAGFCAHLLKPIMFTDLEKLLEKVTAESAPHHGNGASSASQFSTGQFSTGQNLDSPPPPLGRTPEQLPSGDEADLPLL